jgi:hypothetical protein
MTHVVVSKYGGTDTSIYTHGPNETIGGEIQRTNNFFEIDFLDFIKTN